MKRTLLLLFLACTVGCATTSREIGKAGGESSVTHVVLCWLKQPGNSADRHKLIMESVRLEQIPGVANVLAGVPVPSTRPVVDSSYDVAFVITFRNESSLQSYQDHPIHKKAVSEVLRPLTAKILIYDIKRTDVDEARKR